MITIEYNGKIIEVPVNVWNNFEEEQGDALDFLGEDTDIVLNKAEFEKLVAIVENSGSQLGAKIIKQLLYK